MIPNGPVAVKCSNKFVVVSNTPLSAMISFTMNKQERKVNAKNRMNYETLIEFSLRR